MFRLEDVVDYVSDFLSVPLEEARGIVVAMQLRKAAIADEPQIDFGKIGLDLIRDILEVEGFRRALVDADEKSSSVVGNEGRSHDRTPS